MKSIVLKTVLKSGGEYKPEHVQRMLQMLDRYVDCPAKFVCYSDVEIPGITTRPLLHDWPGWWSKLEIFRDFEDSFYIDLDMTITGNITDMVMVDSDFIALRNMNPRIEGIGSAMMKWQEDLSWLYAEFASNTDEYMKDHGKEKTGTPLLGDQGFMWRFLKPDVEFFQDKFPGRIKKFNEHGGDVKVYYGRNRPWKHG